jgi:Na+-transporting NADH:ubiquinone oxidoreductase subunit NqrC
VVAWAGVASSLIAAILLSGAAVCLRSEREKEEQLNLQYLMPGKMAAS